MSNLSARLIFGLLLFAPVMPYASAVEYTLMPSPQTVHIGHFSAALKPVLTINSGDIVTIETATSLDPAEVDQSGAVPPSAVPEYQRAIHREVKDRGPSGHVLTGPISSTARNPATRWRFASWRSILRSTMATTVSDLTRARCQTNSLVCSNASSRSIARARPHRSRPE
jgi:hypothetical protein